MALHKKITTAVLTLVAASAATAQAAYFDNIVAGEAMNGTDISVIIQKSSLDGYDYEFVIENNTHCDDATITGLYFEDGWERYFSDNPGNSMISPSNFDEDNYVPLHNGVGVPGWTSSLVSYEVAGLGSGIGPDQAAAIFYEAVDDTLLLEDLEILIGTPGFGIALRLQNLPEQDPGATAFAFAGNSGSISREHQDCLVEVGNEGGPVMPEPTSGVVMGLGALMGIALKRRRRDV